MTQPLNRMRQNEKNRHKNRPCKRALKIIYGMHDLNLMHVQASSFAGLDNHLSTREDLNYVINDLKAVANPQGTLFNLVSNNVNNACISSFKTCKTF